MAEEIKTRISKSGADLLRDPLLNKGTAFTHRERQVFDLEGLLPHRTATIEEQAKRFFEGLDRLDDPLEKYISLAALQDRNEHLYFYLLRQHLETLLPIVYTPTVGLATMRFSHVFQRGRGVWITPDTAGSVAATLRRAARGRDIKLIVVTDNESILGLGDQGAGGIEISIGKLAIYTAAAGIDPATVLPVSLDVGTENQSLLDDPMYLGWPERRLRGERYDALVEEFVCGVRSEFPGALIQWEDFRKDNALAVMDRYQSRVLSFNDDIQGTGAVALSGILSAQRIHGRPLTQERILIVGAGAAGLGIFRQIRNALLEEGLPDEELGRAIAVLDSRGLVVNDRNLADGYKQEFAWSPSLARRWNIGERDRGLETVCGRYQPTVLIGTSGQRGVFSEPVVRSMMRSTDRPVILPMSNPTEFSEAMPQDLFDWTNGRALVATGSPFADVTVSGRKRRVGQANNAFIFPGVGLGALWSGTDRITDDLFYAAGRALAESVTDEELESGLLYPAISRLHEVSLQIARRVLERAGETGLVAPAGDSQTEDLLAQVWVPAYPSFDKAPPD
jgi:malate dehydrogenase (oxaloacetate-decarboxylating)